YYFAKVTLLVIPSGEYIHSPFSLSHKSQTRSSLNQGLLCLCLRNS
ncbi:hypothetical protein LINPERHAP2_LOCUS24524, partial [Linum perenne]